MKKIIIIFLLIFISEVIHSDVLMTKDGMIINGKVIKEKEDAIIFKNKYGTFKIARKKIKKLQKTRSYKEDVSILQQQGKKVNAVEIKQNYDEGERAKKELLTKKNYEIKSSILKREGVTCEPEVF